jgi:LCP family protein required for cell wall assembly
MRRLVLVCSVFLFILASCLSPLGKSQIRASDPGKDYTLTPSSDATNSTSNPLGQYPVLWTVTPEGTNFGAASATSTPRATAPARNWPGPGSFGSPPRPATAVPPPIAPFAMEDDVVNIMLLGSDRRTGRYFRTDIIIIVSIHPSARAAAMISIPRDLYVYIPGYTMQRINTAYLFGDYLSYPGGGPALLKDTILYNFGIQIDHYALIDMSGFQRLVDSLGGIEIHVSCPYTDWRLKQPDLYPEDENNWALYTVSPGVVTANGEFALWYARSRKRSSDFDRSRRQQEVLRAIYRKIMSLDLIPRIPALYTDLTSMVATDMGVGDLIALAPLAFRIDPSRVRSRFVGTDQVNPWRTPTGGAVQIPEPGAIEALLRDVLAFEEEDFLVPGYEISVEVVNASSHAEYDTLAAERLIYEGFDAVVSDEGATPSSTTRLIDYGFGSDADRQRLASALNLSSSAISVEPNLSSPYSYRLLVGNNYSPCFNPTRNQSN